MIYDAIIVGAGPAGSTCAAALSKYGLRVLVIDKCTFPREKTCGGLISRKTINLLPKEFGREIDNNQIFKLNLKYPDGNIVSYKSDEILGAVVKRSDFDYYLLKTAQSYGASFMESCRYHYHKKENEHYKIYTNRGTFKARYLVGADGCFSRVAKDSGMRNKWTPWEMGIALSMQIPKEYLQNMDYEAVDFFFPKVLGGMGWCFPGKDFINLGIGGWNLDTNNVVFCLKELIRSKMKLKNNVSEFRIKGAYLAAGGLRRKIGEDRVFLIGDAAGLVDGFSGEGIYYSVRSAKIASEVISRNLPGQIYQQKCYKFMLSEFRLSALMSIMLGNRQIHDLALQKQLCEGFYKIMTQEPDNNCYKKLMCDMMLKKISLYGPFLWIKRLFFAYIS